MEITGGICSADERKMSSKNDTPVTVYRIIDVSHIVTNTRSISKPVGLKKVQKSVKSLDYQTVNQEIVTEVQKDTRSTLRSSPIISSSVECSSNSNTSSSRRPLELGTSIQETVRFVRKSNNYACTICEKIFQHSSHLKRHINTQHTAEKLYNCDVCTKTFLDTSTLSRHRKIHSGDKPWSCKVCKKNFSTLGSLRRHTTVHNQEGRPFMCTTCKKRFPDNSSFQKHIFIHTGKKPHVCNICSKAFVHVGDLNGHRKIHIGVKPYKCERCEREFSKRSNYSRHLMIHEGNKEYTCERCGVGYNFQSSLTRHLLTHVKKISQRKSSKEDGI